MIYLSKKIKQQIQKESEKYYPNECCGILFGKLEETFFPKRKSEHGESSPDSGEWIETGYSKHAAGIWPISNSFVPDEQYHRFLITPEMMRKAELEARKSNLDIIGFYHSHPDCPAIPSEYDREYALPVYSYLITSVIMGIAVETNCFTLSKEAEFYQENICEAEENAV